MNIYEQMLLTDKAALESKISNLVKEQLNSNEKAAEELNLISKVIDYDFTITDTCSFEVDYPHIRGEKDFGSIEDYQKRDQHHYDDAVEAESGGVSWDGATDFYGSFSWDGCPSVSVEVEGLTEDASEEAKTLWEAQSNEQERQDRLDWKRQRMEQTQKQLLELQAEVAAAEANE